MKSLLFIVLLLSVSAQAQDLDSRILSALIKQSAADLHPKSGNKPMAVHAPKNDREKAVSISNNSAAAGALHIQQQLHENHPIKKPSVHPKPLPKPLPKPKK